jgi:hypothetical protein
MISVRGQNVGLRILFVAMANSIHTAHWMDQLNGLGWDIRLFPVEDVLPHPDLKQITVHDVMFSAGFSQLPQLKNRAIRLVDRFWPIWRGGWPFPRGAGLARRVVESRIPLFRERAWRLARTIEQIKPDMVHSLEIQHAGYLTLDAKRLIPSGFPKWIVTCWGSDIYLFGRLAEHKERVRAVLSECDYLSADCQRDIELARALGFIRESLPVFPGGGGYDLRRMLRHRAPGPVSARRLIMLKGYQTWSGRALTALRAIELCQDCLQGYRVAVYSTSPEVKIAAELTSQSTGIPIDIVPACSDEELWALRGRTRIHIGLGISDGSSPAILEAMVLGSFPIQSYTSCADEWIQDGESGLLVPPEDQQAVATAIRRAVSDDALVDRAAEINARVCAERLERSFMSAQAIAMYRRIAAQTSAKSSPAGDAL